MEQVFKITDMTCTSCEKRIKKAFVSLSDLNEVDVSYEKGTLKLTSDNVYPEDTVRKVIEKLGYTYGGVVTDEVEERKSFNWKHIFLGFIIIILFIILQQTGIFDIFPRVDSGMSNFAIFIVGIATSVHCISMCGGINLSVCMGVNNKVGDKTKALLPAFFYNLGRVISYTLVGGIAGGLGSVVSFSGKARGLIAIVAAIFMFFMALNMLGNFPLLRKLVPKMPKFIEDKLATKTPKTPIFIGLLNGLMPCGPLQSMQIFALGTGSFIAGATSMFFFSLGTVPLMMLFGAVSSILKKKYTDIVMKIGAIFMIFLALSMLATGLALSGVYLPF